MRERCRWSMLFSKLETLISCPLLASFRASAFPLLPNLFSSEPLILQLCLASWRREGFHWALAFRGVRSGNISSELRQENYSEPNIIV